MNSVEIINVTKKYKKGSLALNSMNLLVPATGIMGLLGPNGAGKSTLFNIIAGIVIKDNGVIKIFEKEIANNDFNYKRNIGFVLEEPYYIDKLSVREYLEFVGSMYDLDKLEVQKRTAELIEFFDLTEKQDEWIENYSTGMKKKVSLAAAIMHRPKLLILDEPLEGIDPISAKRIKDNLKLMSQNGTSVLISSHLLDTIEKLCDEIAIINKGRIVFQSKTEDIRTKIKNELTQETYQSLEEIFIDVVSEKKEEQPLKGKLSWL